MSEDKEQGTGRERRLAAIMLTDIVGYSRKMSDDEESALRMLELHNRLLFPVIAAHGGRVLKTMGDAILAEFGSVVQAVKCALKIQSELRTHNEALPPAERIEVRIGIHVGDVVVTDGDMFGDGVNIAARIQPLAEPGGVCISSVVHSQIKNMPEFMSVSMGKRHLKNIPDPVEVLRIQPSAGGVVLGPSRSALKLALLAAVVLAAAGALAWRLGARPPVRAPAASDAAPETYLVRPASSIIAEAGQRSERVRALAARGRSAEAVAELERALDLFPQLPETAWTPDEVARARPIFAGWTGYLEELARREPGSPDALRAQGKLLFRLGDGDRAFATLDSACKLGDRWSCRFVKDNTVTGSR